jgi:nucleoside-triphosphatase
MTKLLITGVPGVGKTTFVRRLAEALESRRPVGFYTAEIREAGVRKGFELIGFDGRRQVLAHVKLKTRYKVGKYGVDVSNFDRFLDTIEFFGPDSNLIVLDEIGSMECHSKKFIALLEKIMRSDKTVIATVALRGGGSIADLKKTQDVRLIEITPSNRNSGISHALAIIQQK